jgi:nucleoid DNA-binding protein
MSQFIFLKDWQMKKKYFIPLLARRAGCTQKVADNVLKAIHEVISEQLKNDETAKLPYFGKFIVRKRPIRTIINVVTKQRTKTKPRPYIHFKPLKDF